MNDGVAGLNPPYLRSESSPSRATAWDADLSRLIAEYRAQLRVEGKTDDTIRIYGLTLRNLQQAVEAGILPANVTDWTARDLVQFFSWLAFKPDGARRLAPASLHQRQRSTRTFLNWCVAAGVLQKNPMDSVKNVKIPDTIKPSVKEGEVGDLIEMAKHGPTPSLRARNLAILLFILDAGPRIQELCGIQMDDVLWDERLIHIREGKGQKERYLPLSDAVYVALAEYVRQWRPRVEGALFIGSNGQAITDTAVARMLWRLGERSGLRERLGPHMLRRTFATLALDNGAELQHVQELMGHNDPRTTLRHYARQRNMKIAAEAHKAFSPVDRALKEKRSP